MPPKPPPALPPHPAVRQSLSLLLMGVGTLVYGVAKLPGPDGWITGPIMLSVAGGLIWVGLFVRLSAPGAQAVNVALNLVLIPRHGAIGAAWATLAAYAYAAVVGTAIDRRTRPLALMLLRAFAPRALIHALRSDVPSLVRSAGSRASGHGADS